jgi:hypothetical protein
MILSDDVGGDDSIDDERECDGDNVERRESDGESAEDATPDDYCRSEVDATDRCFHWAGQDAVGYGEMFYTHSTQMAKYSDKITRGY